MVLSFVQATESVCLLIVCCRCYVLPLLVLAHIYLPLSDQAEIHNTCRVMYWLAPVWHQMLARYPIDDKFCQTLLWCCLLDLIPTGHMCSSHPGCISDQITPPLRSPLYCCMRRTSNCWWTPYGRASVALSDLRNVWHQRHAIMDVVSAWQL